LFVLVSHRTVSGGEEMAYDLQAQKRAPLLGEPTTGAANPAPRFELGDGFRVFIPVARAINPITHTNWEGTGVLPDVAVDPAQAQERALSMAGLPAKNGGAR
jgi:C-terminal processing protease CtpA/Prc